MSKIYPEILVSLKCWINYIKIKEYLRQIKSIKLFWGCLNLSGSY